MEILVSRTAAGHFVAEGEHAEALARLCKLKRDSQRRVQFPAEAWAGYAADLRARGVVLVEQTTIEPEPEADVNQNHQLLLG